MVYLHPVVGGLTVFMVLVAGSLGLEARRPRKRAIKARKWHGYVAPTAFGLMWANAALGTWSTFALRDDLDVGTSWHFGLGWLAVAIMTSAAVSSRWLPAAWARRWHPIAGIVSAGLVLVQGMLGLGLLPY